VLGISVLMVSHVLYPVVPKFSIRTRKGMVTIALFVTAIVLAFTVPSYFFFPFAALYITYGLVRGTVLGFLERLPDDDPLIDIDEDDEEKRELEYEEMDPRALPPRPYRGQRMHEET
jgi:hypothetical protein